MLICLFWFFFCQCSDTQRLWENLRLTLHPCVDLSPPGAESEVQQQQTSAARQLLSSLMLIILSAVEGGWGGGGRMGMTAELNNRKIMKLWCLKLIKINVTFLKYFSSCFHIICAKRSNNQYFTWKKMLYNSFRVHLCSRLGKWSLCSLSTRWNVHHFQREFNLGLTPAWSPAERTRAQKRQLSSWCSLLPIKTVV